MVVEDNEGIRKVAQYKIQFPPVTKQITLRQANKILYQKIKPVPKENPQDSS
jgi:hypothetical protein